MGLRIVDSRLGLRTALSRMPFRYGVVTVRAAPVATLEVTIETAQGARATGYAADFLAYRWFDKRQHKSLRDNVADLIRAIELAVAAARSAGGYRTAFDLWHHSHTALAAQAPSHDLNALTASFGASMPERAVYDALGRLLQQPVAALIAGGALGIDLARLDPLLAGTDLRRCLPERPLGALWVRHTVGLVDPITAGDVPAGAAVGDGLPETLEDYLRVDGLGYLKVKVAGDLDADLARLTAIAALVERNPSPVAVTLDGNEQYQDLAAFDELVERLRATPALQALDRAILFIEQPLERSVALAPEAAPLLRRIARHKPVIIDEADGTLDAFRVAMGLGYSGVSHKNCKGLAKSLLNLARARHGNEQAGAGRFFLSAEDLTNLPVVPLQADLAAVALLGIAHVERNGHHYFRGLDHLQPTEQAEAVARHGDLYAPCGEGAALRIDGGRIAVGSLQVPGMGFAALPAMEAMVAPQDWLRECTDDGKLGLGIDK